MNAPRLRAGIVASILAVACATNDAPTGLRESRPSYSISDAVHGGGNAHFFLLPPMVSQPTYAGAFDTTLSPTVEICEWTTHCVSMVARFAGDAVARSAVAEQYSVNWNTHQCMSGSCTLDPSKTYRIRFLVATTELGFADVVLVSNGSMLKNVQTSEYIGLVDGRTLPIKFRVEQGAIVVLQPGQPTDVGIAGGQLTNVDGSGALLIPAGALSASTPISMIATTGAGDFAPTLDLGPDGTQFNVPVTLTMPYEPSRLPPGVLPRDLRVVMFDGTGWREVAGSAVDEDAATLSAPISHFSTYSVSVGPNGATGTVSPTTLEVGQTTVLSAYAWVHTTVPGQTLCYPVYSYVNTSNGWGGSWIRYVSGIHCETTPGQVLTYPAVNFAVTWSCSNSATAQVPAGPTYTNSSGVALSPAVRAIAPGSAAIRGMLGTMSSSSALITVVPPAPPSGTIAVVSTRFTQPGKTADIVVMNADGSGARVAARSPDAVNEGPDLSPDGQTVVFSSTRSGAWEVYAADVVTGVTSSLTGYNAITRFPKWSRDGTQIVFYSNRDGDHDIWVMNADGSGAHQVTNDPGDEFLPTWSPDGQRIAFLSNRTGTNQLYVVDIATGAERQITFDAGTHNSPRWAPTGSRVAFMEFDAIWTVDVDNGSLPVRLTPSDASESEPCWSPDGAHLIFQSTRNSGHSQLWSVDPDGSNLHLFIATPFDDVSPSWVAAPLPPPFAGLLAVVSARFSAPGATADVVVMNLDGSNPRVLASSTDAYEEYPDISPDRTTVVFSSTRATYWGIFSVGVDGTGLRRLDTFNAYTRLPKWSSDGAHIAFYSNADGDHDIYVMNADGSGVHQVTNDPGDEYAPTWSPDGARIAFLSYRTGTPQLYVVDLASGAERQITTGAAVESPRWAPSGARVAFSSQGSIWVVDVDSGSPMRLTPGDASDSNPCWSPDGTSILFDSSRGAPGGSSYLWMMNADGTNLHLHLTDGVFPSWR